jgi:predicted transcriptional regulator YdeE
MKKAATSKSVIKLVGLSIRTSNQKELDPATAKIGLLVQDYFGLGVANQIQDRQNPGVTYSVYTEYESDHTGEYTYFIGEEVSSIDNVPNGLRIITIPESQYQRFTTAPGVMPAVVIQAWQSIWQMSPQELGGERRYLADFEIYDQRAMDPNSTVVDIYIGTQ